MELFVDLHFILITSLLLSVFRSITCQDPVETPATVYVTEGDTAIIECRFDPSTLVALNWKKGGDVNSAADVIRLFRTTKIPGMDPRFDMTSDYSLMINGTAQADSGVYWCQVTLQGVFQSSTNLTVLPVTTTPGRETSKDTAKPTNPEPKKQTGNNTTLYIIIGACGGVVSLAILVLICYCCCCKRKTPNGYAKPNPNTPV